MCPASESVTRLGSMDAFKGLAISFIAVLHVQYGGLHNRGFPGRDGEDAVLCGGAIGGVCGLLFDQ